MQSPLTEISPQPDSAAVAAPQPLITGDVKYLWSGVAAFVVIFVLAFWLLGRWRARAAATRSARNTDFFQPAGEAAEITFDEEAPTDVSSESQNAFDDETPVPATFAAAEPAPKKKSLFAGLFRKRVAPASDETTAETADADGDAEQGQLATVSIEPAGRGGEDEPLEREPPATDWARIEREARLRDQSEAALAEHRRREEEEAERRWRLAEEERQRRMEEDERRRAEREAIAHIDNADRARMTAHADSARTAQEDLARTLSEVEEALHAQREAIQAETRSLLDSFARRFSDRIDALASSVERRAAQRLHDAGAERSGDGALFDAIAARLDDHRREVGDALNALARRIDAGAAPEISALRAEIADLRRSLVGAAPPPAAPSVQLSDIVRDALAPGAYELNALLANNRRADCLIKLARPPGPIAIDAGFPVEAFRDLQTTRSTAAENEFRRAALRHIVDVAERLISPGFTADCAMLFIPSETMAGELFARFPDVIQDSYRARVWIVSPTTLMATLHAMSGVLRGAPLRERSFQGVDEARRALAEIDRLEGRIAALEAEAARGRDDARDMVEAQEHESAHEPMQVGEPSTRRSPLRLAADNAVDAPDGHLYEDDGADPEDEASASRQARPPFPLR